MSRGHTSSNCIQICTIEEGKVHSPSKFAKNSWTYPTNNSSIPNKLTLIHLNIRSLKNRNHFLQLRELIQKKNYHIITLSETWLNTSVKNAEVEIEGYKILRLDRLGKRGGGVCAYVRTPLKAHILKDLSSTSTTWFQQIWIQVQYKKVRSFVICVAYRPPDCPVSCFEDYLKPSLIHALTFNKPITILGDLNCDLLQENHGSLLLKNFVSELNLKQVITSPTRITGTSRSLIDVIMTSASELVQDSGVINISISDHFPVYVVLNLKFPKQPPSYITVRSYKNYNPTLFTADLAAKNAKLIQSIFLEEDVNAKLLKFNDALLSTLKIHAPVKRMRVRHRPCPYITQRIKDLMSNRDSLHRQFQLTRDIIDWRSYKHARQSVKNALKKAEKEYVRGEVLAHKNNAASLWKIINRSIPTKERSIQCYSKSPELIANEFNQFFVAVGEKTAIATTQLAMENNFDVSTTNPILTPTGYAPHETFKLSPVSCTEVERIIISMPSNKSPGPDKVTMSVLKDCVPVVLGPITDIINCSFATSTFPDEWKLAEAIPVLKEGDHEVASNNRPLSLLNVVSKICERVVLNQFNSYLIRNNRLSAQQSGNKKQHSTETLNLLTTDHLLEAMDSKKLSALILIDLSKAFDSISHQILLKKLSDVGASQETVKWFESYLTGRVQQVRIGSSLSAALPITHGVPQGAILSPLLFCIYTNDLPTVTQTSELNSFVDDSKISLSFSIEEVLEAKHKLELDLRLVAEWCCKNALLINPGKTKFLLVGTRQLLNSLPQNMSLNFLNKTLEPVNFTNDLGMTLDCNLTYNKHVSQLTSACMAKLCQINRVKHCFDRNTLIYIICAVVMGKLYYCSTVWSNTTSSNIKKLQAVQNFACRIIVDGKKFDHITPVLRDIGWLPVKEHLLYRDMVMIYKCMNGLAPPYLADLFHKRSELNEYATRNSDSLHIPLFSTTTGQRSFRYRATKLWNSLDEELKKLPLATFKINLKRSMFNKYFER